MNDVYEMLEYMLDILGTETLLDDLIQAMSTDELRENLEFIAGMRDIDFEDED